MATLNASLKADYAAYCAQERARHYSPVSYELWLEGTLNACRLDLANAKRALHLPDSYRAALEQVDKSLEEMELAQPAGLLLQIQLRKVRRYIQKALGGAEEEL